VEIRLAISESLLLLDGTERGIEDLEGVGEFWLYGRTAAGRIVPARAHSARPGGEAVEIVEVYLDNDRTVACLADLGVMMRNGGWARAGALSSGDSLMPLYRRRESMPGSLEYEQLWSPGMAEWEFTHRVVCPDCPRGHVRHHIDFNRFNNSPTNLRVMRSNEHFALHGQSARQMFAEGRHGWQKPNPAKRARDVARMIAYNKSEEHRKAAAMSGAKNMAALWSKPEFRKLHVERGKIIGRLPHVVEARKLGHLRFREDPVRKAAAIEAQTVALRSPANRERARERCTKMQASRSSEDKRKFGQKAMHVRWHVKRGVVSPECWFCRPAPNNHKVAASLLAIGAGQAWSILVADDVVAIAVAAGIFVGRK
jgi:DNA gyrase subunit B